MSYNNLNKEVLVNEVLNTIQDDFYIIDNNWNFVFTSHKFISRISGDPISLIGNNLWETFPERVGTDYETNLRESMYTRKIRRFDLEVKSTSSYYRIIIFPTDVGITVLGIDITERKKVETDLRDSEERYRTLFEHMNEGFFLAEIIRNNENIPVDYRYLASNNAMERLMNMNKEDIVGKVRSQVIADKCNWIETFGRVALTGKSEVFQGFSAFLNSYLSVRVYSPKQGQFACLIDDITKRKNLEVELKQQKDLFEAVIESMHDAISIYDSDGNVNFLNAEFRKLYPHLNDQLSLNNVHKMFNYLDLNENTIPKIDLPTSQVFRGETIRGKKLIIKRPDRLQYTEVNGTPIFNEENNLLSVVVVHRDITDLVLSQQEVKDKQAELLNRAISKNELLETSMKMKDEFLYLITHEFKTPMAIINLALQAIDSLCKDDVTEKLGKFINTIKINTNRQLRLVNNLLDVTRINTGNIKLHRSMFDIVYLTRSIVSSIEIYANQKNISLKFESTFTKKTLYLDEEKFERIMLNLLSNALKFTPKDKCITVSLGSQKLKNKTYITVKIKDEGIGIALDKHEKIFERFGQADTSLSRQAEGTGLGLHLVDLLVNSLGGKITLESEIDKGSEFTIFLPIVKSLSVDEESTNLTFNEQFINGNSRIVQAVSIEFSDLYFD